MKNGKVIAELCTNTGFADLIRFMDTQGANAVDLIRFVNKGKTNKCKQVSQQAMSLVGEAPVLVRGTLVTIARVLENASGTIEVD